MTTLLGRAEAPATADNDSNLIRSDGSSVPLNLAERPPLAELRRRLDRTLRF